MMTRNKKKELKKQHVQELENNTPIVEEPKEDKKTKEPTWSHIKRLSKETYTEIVSDLKNPVKRAVMRRKTSMRLVSILRGFIFVFINNKPINQSFSFAEFDVKTFFKF